VLRFSRVTAPRLRVLPTIIDRYVVAEVLPPTGLGLVLFSFILMLNHITQLTGLLIARGADLPTILRIFLNLLPSVLATTIPMAFLLGVLLAFGRLASDSEIVALRASGVSAAQMLRPVLVLSAVAATITFYVLAVSLPAANQAFREVYYSLVVSKARSGVKPRVFTDDLVPGLVLYVSDVPAETGEWTDVFIHDGRDPQRPRAILARTGRLVIDDARERVELHLRKGKEYIQKAREPGAGAAPDFDEQHFSWLATPLDFGQLFPKLPIAKGDREMTLGELRARILGLTAQGRPAREIAPYQVELHKKFAIAAACLVFGLLGVALSLGSRKEARSAAFSLSIAVIFIYYVFIRLGEQAGDTGLLSPLLAMWGANIVLGAAAFALLALNHYQAAFDPLDPAQYTAWLPRIRRGARPAQATDAVRARRPRPAVVVRIPRLRLPLPGLLDRYVSRAYLGHFALVLLSFWVIFLLAHFMDLFDDVQHNRVKGVVVAHYYTYYSPAIFYLVLPVSTLVAPLITFGILTRRNEITAMKAGGISLYRTVLPVVVLGIAQSALLFGAGEYVLPYTNKIAERDFNVIKGRPPQSSSFLEKHWILGSDDRIYNYEYMAGATAAGNGAGTALYGLSIYEVDSRTWELRSRVYASRAGWTPLAARSGRSETAGLYELERGFRCNFSPATACRAFDLARSREIEPPSYFMQQLPEAETMRYRELRAHIASLEARGLDVVKLKVQLERKVAFPMVCLVMTLIGIPFAFFVGRKGALYGIGISIVIAIVYWGCLGIFEALGNNALLPPLLAAWAPNLLFGVAGMYLMLTLDT
jgi:LPS export ABC transporter permease LptF/LPS export ABC transporter permease LptG